MCQFLGPEIVKNAAGLAGLVDLMSELMFGFDKGDIRRKDYCSLLPSNIHRICRWKKMNK